MRHENTKEITLRTLKKRIKSLLEGLIGRKIESFGNWSFALINKNSTTDDWFLYRNRLQFIFDKCKIDLVLDVGANEGQFARALRPMYKGDIHSFEPVSSVFNSLAASASSDPKWRVHKFALGSNDSSQTINVSNLAAFSSLLKTTEYGVRQFGEQVTVTKEEVVPVRRLDGLLHEIVPDSHEKHIFLKLDTQGYDLEVFKGLGDSLEHVYALQSEVSLLQIYEGMPTWLQSISVYEKAGFQVSGMFPVVQYEGKIIEFDCLMIKGEA
jgi:FkbM family methyltransferase